MPTRKGGEKSAVKINSLNQGIERGNSLYKKLWTRLDNREKWALRSTND